MQGGRQMWLLHWNGDSWRRIPTCAPQLPQNKAGYSEEQSLRKVADWREGPVDETQAHVIEVFCAEVWGFRPNKNRGFFSLSSFLPCFLHSFLPIFLPFFILSFQPFFLLSIYIHKVHILGLLDRCDRQQCLPHAGQQN